MSETDTIKKGSKIRTPCCAVLGHVDVGKTKLLDYMRRTETEEASGITQQIGTTLYNRERLEKLVGDNLKHKFNIDSMLMIDTPGHECFDMIRYVALIVSDVVILMVDMLKGLEKQTIHVVSLLLKHNVPFIICLNKMDRIYGWVKPKPGENLNLASVLKRMGQKSDVRNRYTSCVQQIQQRLYDYDVSSELYYQNSSPQDIVNIVPISAETGEGIPDLIMLISAMAEKRYLNDALVESNITHGYVLDTHHDKRSGHYLVALHRNGSLKRGDTVMVDKHEYLVKSIMTNSDNKELKDDHKFIRSEDIDRSIGYGLVLEPVMQLSHNKTTTNYSMDSIEPSSVYVLKNDYDMIMNGPGIDRYHRLVHNAARDEYEKRWNSYLCEKGTPGIQVIAPSHIMMDGLLYMIRQGGTQREQEDQRKTSKTAKKIIQKNPDTNETKEIVPIERYKIGKIDKKDLIISGRWLEKSDIEVPKILRKRYSVILSYDPSTEKLSKEILDLAKSYNVTIIHSDVVYKLLESYEAYVNDLEKRNNIALNEPDAVIKIIPKYVFRTTNPMIFGVQILNGSIKPSDKVFSDRNGEHHVGKIESIQNDGKTVTKSEKDSEVCLKIETSTKVIGKDFADDAELFVRCS